MTGLIYPVPESSPNAPGVTAYVVNPRERTLASRLRHLLCALTGCTFIGVGARGPCTPDICRFCLRVGWTPEPYDHLAALGNVKMKPFVPTPEVAARAAEYAAHRRDRFGAAIAEATARDLAAAGVQLGGDPVSLIAEASEASAPAGVVKGEAS